jgi:hypothetical protein
MMSPRKVGSDEILNHQFIKHRYFSQECKTKCKKCKKNLNVKNKSIFFYIKNYIKKIFNLIIKKFK